MLWGIARTEPNHRHPYFKMVRFVTGIYNKNFKKMIKDKRISHSITKQPWNVESYMGFKGA